MTPLINELSQYWLDGAFRAAGGALRGLSDPYPVHEDPAGASDYDVVHQGDLMRLRYYPAQGRPRATPVLLVYALIKRPFILDLLPGRSVVESLTRQGFEVYLTDWVPPTRTDNWRGFDDYVNCELYDAVNAVTRHAGVEQVNMLGYCFGGLLSVIWTALYPDAVKNLVTLATPIDASVEGSPLYTLAARLPDEVLDSILQLHGNCPAALINGWFTAMAPVHHALSKYLDLHTNKRNTGYLEMFTRFERWMNSDVPLAGGIFREMVEQVFRANRLVSSEFRIGNGTVDLKRITCPLLNIIATYDDVVPVGASLPLLDLTKSSDGRNLMFPAGHIGSTVSASAHNKLWPEVGAWLAERDSQLLS